jgi:hypothetical protein
MNTGILLISRLGLTHVPMAQPSALTTSDLLALATHDGWQSTSVHRACSHDLADTGEEEGR